MRKNDGLAQSLRRITEVLGRIKKNYEAGSRPVSHQFTDPRTGEKIPYRYLPPDSDKMIGFAAFNPEPVLNEELSKRGALISERHENVQHYIVPAKWVRAASLVDPSIEAAVGGRVILAFDGGYAVRIENHEGQPETIFVPADELANMDTSSLEYGQEQS